MNAINPTTNQYFYMVFVNAGNAKLMNENIEINVDVANNTIPNGTFENPYTTLLQAQINSKPGDILYVFSGSGNMNQGLILQSDQQLWGSGISHHITTTKGYITIPTFTNTNPVLTNTLGDGITLSFNNRIEGITLSNVMGNAIFGIDVQDCFISYCTITGSELDQVHLEYVNGDSNPIILLDNLSFSNGNQNDIYIQSAQPIMLCTISNSKIPNAILTSFDENVTINVLNNTITEDSAQFTFASAAKLTVANNIFTGSTSISSRPLTIITTLPMLSGDTIPSSLQTMVTRNLGDGIQVSIQNNTFNNNTCGAIFLSMTNTNKIQLDINNNTITNNGSGSEASLGSAIVLALNNTTVANMFMTLTNNTISKNGSNVLYCSDGLIDSFDFHATSNQCIGNGAAGFVFNVYCNIFTLIANDNTIANGNDHGIATDSVLMGVVTMSFTNNIITSNQNYANGIVLSHSGNSLELIVQGNTFNNNDGSGFLIYSADGIESVNAIITNNTVKNNMNNGSNASGGIDIEQFNNLCMTFNNNTFSNNVDSGCYIGLTFNGLVCLDMTNNTSDANYVLNNGSDSGVFQLAPINVSEVNVGTITMSGIITLVDSCNC